MSWLNNILLVYPQIPTNTYWSFHYTLKFVGKKSAMPPLGLITMAAMLPERYNLKLVDLNIEDLRPEDIDWADAVFVSAMIIQQESLRDVIASCNQRQTPVVAGGPYPSSSYPDIDGVDHFVIGEAENIMADFLADLENQTARPLYESQEKPDLNQTVVPRFDLLQMEAYASMALQYSRGCPFKCEFCDIWITYGNKPRLKSADNLTKELDELYRLGWRDSIFLVDDNFIGNKKRVKTELLPALQQWQQDKDHYYKFYTEASINMADDKELMAGMAQAGIDQVFIGIETPAPEGLAETGKTQNLKGDMQAAIRTIQAHGIEVTAGFILGFDSDTEDIFDRQIAFIQEAGIPKAMIGLLHALPGTLLYQRLKKENRLGNLLLGSNTHCMATNVRTIMDPETLKAGYKKVLSTIYDRNLKNYFQRCDQLLANLQNTGYTQRKIRLHEIKALLKSLVLQPFTPYGYQYLKFITRNLKNNPHLFAEVITHAVMGHHFYLITRQTLQADKVTTRLDDLYRKARAQLAAARTPAPAAAGSAISADPDKLWRQWYKKLLRIKIRINRLPDDFRGDVIAKYQEIYDKTRSLFTEAKNNQQAHQGSRQ